MIRLFCVLAVILIAGCGKTIPPDENSKEKSFSTPVAELSSGVITDTLSYPVEFSISYPSNWEKFDSEESVFIFGAKMKCDSGVVFCPNFNITLIKEIEGLSLELYGKSIIEDDPVLKKKEAFDLIISNLNNGMVRTLTYNQKFEYNDVKLGGVARVTQIKGRSHLLFITFMAERGEADEYVSKENQQLFHQILNSMTFFL
ncbi:MAG: hypothetical protein R3C61_28440 [Bacteroidia bacterium]